MNQNPDKKKLCRFKENCPNFMAKKQCNFDHVQCKFKDSCKDKDSCRFYHLAGSSSAMKQSFDKPKQQTLCKFDGTCSRSNCTFKHEKGQKLQNNNMEQQKRNVSPQIFPGQKNSKVCTFGVKCFKQNCTYLHPERQNQNSQNKEQIKSGFQSDNRIQGGLFGQNNQTSVQTNAMQVQIRREDNRYCLKYTLLNNCQAGEGCNKSHEFTQKSSIKRIFLTNQFTQKNLNVTFYEHAKQGNESQNNKELIYAVQQKDKISFRKLISSQNLYEDFGGICHNQQNKTYLRCISTRFFQSQQQIQGIQAFTYDKNQYLVFLAGYKICIYNTSTGQVHVIASQKINNKLTGCVFIQKNKTLLISTLEQGFKRLQFNCQRKVFQQKPFNEQGARIGMKVFKSSQTQILGEMILCGISTQGTKVILMNSDLRCTVINLQGVTQIHDFQVLILNNKIPVVLLTVSSLNRGQVMGMNLLNFDKQVLFQYDFTSGLNKIFTSQNHLFIEVRNKGLLVYKINEFQKQVGVIPFMNLIKSVKKDNKGNLLIVEQSSVDSKGSISIFKVKKI